MSGSVSARSFGRDVTNKLTPRGVKWESPAAAGQDGNHVVDMPSFAAASINMADVKVAAFFTFVGSPFLDLVRLESYGARTWEGLGPPLDDFLRTRRDEAEAMALIEEGKGVGLFFTSSGTKFAHLLQVSAHESLREVNQAIINRLKLKRIAQVQGGAGGTGCHAGRWGRIKARVAWPPPRRHTSWCGGVRTGAGDAV